MATGKKKINLSLSQLVKHLTTSADNKLSFDRMLALKKKCPQKYIHVYNTNTINTINTNAQKYYTWTLLI